ncbi:PASTA domain-containing protein [Streptacidiphilus carbonis]|uniref:PASTA domain-containing protein n=1 Tax=Streptacidiphilus carbonis TaxID=105422 RepID=UPI000694317F|nr:PASTA domain-containing protein [Streptacidiphilus carbonis]
MASSPGPQPYLVTVPDLIGLSPQQARDFARRAQLVAAGPDPDARPAMDGTVSAQAPGAGSLAARWSTVVIWTVHRGGGPGGDAGVREPRNPSPPPLAVSVHDPEPGPEPPMGHVTVEQLDEPAAE